MAHPLPVLQNYLSLANRGTYRRDFLGGAGTGHTRVTDTYAILWHPYITA